ncbi:MAG: sugar ABC transporter substrate-binding protein, partial [Propionicimonas sp.]|nr:sugar ABC transporter substrate-binding protein [Propionicimonas sp.]
GVLADLTDKLDDLGVSDWASAGQVESGQYNGATYSLPNITGPSFLLYNKDLYAKAGLPDRAPSTWAEIRSDAEAIRALGDDVYGYDIPGACGGCLAFTFQPLIWASDGTTMTAPGPDQTTTYSTSPQAARAFEFYRDMWADGLVAPSAQTEAGATWGQDFLAGKVGIMLAGAWIYTGAQADGLDIGIGPIPGETGGYSTFAGGNNLGITSSSEKADAAWTFLKWVYEDSQQMEIIKTGEAPARQVAFTDEIVAENPLLAITQQVGDRSVAPASIAYNSLQLAASSPWLAAFQSIVFQGGDTASTLQKADEDSRQLIVQAYEQTVQ